MSDSEPTLPSHDAPPSIRRFELVRYEDESGVSGVGRVAVGVKFPSGYCEIEWLNDENDRVQTEFNGHASYPGGIDDVREVHGHGGRTEVRWMDPEPGFHDTTSRLPEDLQDPDDRELDPIPEEDEHR